ncbi:probable cytochrome C-type biogenesis protein [Psychrobacter arcticus 273-4]|uniref:Cytochrome c-type biogenesis protein n=1 Tax=Psychrobacter arcticus (strain DSM 17307 / VKM B-2377 / 273-4) TaxID=259536 RepID=Q4FRF1_PSYA2|nr:cytochrome c-type biogenesis protein [Psychrobacter arcticus]AAZ19407.1 probable cytochrome C-type biogenesis protein [Psychrobacter arcticus 273-4]
MMIMPFKSITKNLASLIIACLFGVLSIHAYAAIDVYDFDSVQQEAQYRGLIEELRCPKCQNQNLAGSDAPIAQDLKQKTYDMIKEGRSDGEIRAYMQERYGDFITYKPPVRPSTWILWFFPPLLLITLIVGWFWQSKRSQRIARGQSGTIVDSVAALSAAEKSELERLLSRANRNDSVKNSDQDITSIEDKK